MRRAAKWGCMPNSRKPRKPVKTVIKALIHWCESAKRSSCRAACGQNNPGSYDTNIQHVTCVKCRNAAKKMLKPDLLPWARKRQPAREETKGE
jgi:hypothetical protein